MHRLGLVPRIALIGLGTIVGIVALVVAAALAYTALERTSYPNAGIAFVEPLRVPPLLEPRLVDGVKVFDLAVRAGHMQFRPGVETATLGFNGDYLGPTLRASTGDRVQFRIDNALTEAVTVHWHGMELPAAMDGGPHQLIDPGSAWEPHWTIINQAATLWYHSHMAAKTGEQVYRGLAGMFVIDDANADALPLPREYGIDDIPLIVQDRQFDAGGQFVYRPEHNSFLSPGMLGDTILVNGTYAPYVELPAKLVRLRLLNGSNARRYNFAFSDGRPFHQIASDGALLETPVQRQNLLLAPAERAEILLDLSGASEPVTLLSLAIDDPVDPIVNLSQALLVPGNDENQQFEILEIRPQPGAYPRQPSPSN